MNGELTTSSDEIETPKVESETLDAGDEKGTTRNGSTNGDTNSKPTPKVSYSPSGFAIMMMAGIWSAQDHQWAQDPEHKSLLVEALFILMMKHDMYEDDVLELYEIIGSMWKMYEKKYNPSYESSEDGD